jgi:hypothetical protein
MLIALGFDVNNSPALTSNYLHIYTCKTPNIAGIFAAHIITGIKEASFSATELPAPSFSVFVTNKNRVLNSNTET